MQVELSKVRLVGDFVLSSFFRIGPNKSPTALRREYARQIISNEVISVPNPLESQRYEDKPLASFHWGN